MINSKLNNWLIICATALLVTFYISFALVAYNAGLQNNFILTWLRSWLFAFLLAIPSLKYVGPFIRQLLTRKLK